MGLAAFEEMLVGSRAQLITFTAVVSALGVQVPERPLQLFNEMQQQGLEPNQITYLVVSSASKSGKLWVRPCGSMYAAAGTRAQQLTYTAVQ